VALRVGIDTGGTFTDLVVLDETGRATQFKVPSTPDDPARALVEGVSRIQGEIVSIAHGTTVATNAMLEERFHELALITTRGFRHVLEIARQSVPSGYGNSYFWVKPERIVPLERVREVGERLDFRGSVLSPLDEEDARLAARWARNAGIAVVGICFLHSYANPAHERRMREILLEEHPSCVVSISSEVWPEYREYERTVTTLIDAFVKPHVSGYVERAAARLREQAPAAPLLIMKSNGGVLPAAAVLRRPIATALSGPAAGALGASWLARQAGFERVITIDTGGTSTDVCLVEGAEPQLTKEGRIGQFPVRLPMIDIVSVGTGGGSIAWAGADGGLRVGPRSAGAAPGPMAYGRGGSQPTVTDAALVLGLLPEELAGGTIRLRTDLAQAGIDAGLADDGPAGPRPQYADDYYAAFLKDPAGNGFEAVHRNGQRPRGIIDHVAIRVTDVEASTAFYSTIGEAAGRLGIAAGKVKSRSYYAVRALRAAFDEMGILR